MIFDRYAVEIALLALFAVTANSPLPDVNGDDAAAKGTRWRRRIRCAVLGLLVGFQLVFAFQTKISVDDAAARCVLYERALRAQQIKPSELADAPFPLRGWHLHAHALAHPLPGRRTIAGYSRFLEPTITLWQEHSSWFARPTRGVVTEPPPQESQIVAGASFPSAWFGTKRYALVRKAPSNELEVLGADYRSVPLPLTNAEWRQLIDGAVLP